MDGHGFDLLAKRLALITTRRTGVRLLLAGAGIAGLLGLDVEDAAAACGGSGARCENGGSCCSKICLRGRKKKGKRGRKKGRCDCSFPQEGCNSANDCCFSTSTCNDNGCDPDNRCCEGAEAECIDPCDCCADFTCDIAAGQEFGLCVPCVQLQEPCTAGDFCCADGSFCDDNGSGPQDVCCLDAGFECADDFDCCGERRCSSRAEDTCQSCPALGEFCNPSNNTCCDKDATCFDNACDEPGDRCCLEAGGSCETDCDCCEDHVCQLATMTCQRDLNRQGAETESQPSLSELTGDTAGRSRSGAKVRQSRTASRKRKHRR